jgi:starch synthase
VGAAGRDGAAPAVAIVPWGQVIEDYLDAIGLDVDGFTEEMGGGWLFGYVDALVTTGVRSVLVCVSRSVTRPERRIHGATGAALWLLPPTPAWRWARTLVADPYAWSPSQAVRDRDGEGAGASAVRRRAALLAHHALPWLATPPRLLARVLREEGCRALLCQEYEDARFDTCVALGRVVGVPVFGAFQGGDASRTPLERRTRRRAVRSAAGLVVGSAPEATRLRHTYGVPASRIAAVPNPLDLAAWPVGDRAAARAELGLAPDAGVVAWHGRVELDRKGLDVLAEAWARITAARPGRALHLLLCGTGPDSPLLRARLGGAPSVDWHDEYVLDRTIIRTRLAAADVGVLPSRHEGFPVALAEMMAGGRAVVAADVPGVADMLPGGEADGGTIVRPGDPVALAAALGALLDDRAQAHALGARARHRVAAALSPPAVGRALAGALGLTGGR